MLNIFIQRNKWYVKGLRINKQKEKKIESIINIPGGR